MRDNQNRNLEATKRAMEIESHAHNVGMARVENNIRKMTFAEWTTVDGVEVLRIGGGKFVAVPSTGRKDSRRFDIINLETHEFVCQVNNKNVRNWLIKAIA